MSVHRFVLLMGVCCLTLPAAGHGFSFTHIEVVVKGDDLAVTLDLNQSDLLDRALGLPHERGRFADRQEFEDAAGRVLEYVLGRLRVSADGRVLAVKASDWPPARVELTRVDTSGLEVPNVIPMTLHYPLPAGARRVVIEPRIFSGEDFAAKFDVRITRGDGSKPLTRVVEKGGEIAFEPVGEKSKGDDTGKNGWMIAIVIVVLAAAWGWTRRRGRTAVNNR